MHSYYCTVCGYIHEGDSPPPVCPVCGVTAQQFKDMGKIEDTKEKDN